MVNTFRGNMQRILTEYNNASQEQFAMHPLAHMIRHDFPSSLRNQTEDSDRYLWKGSAGQGN